MHAVRADGLRQGQVVVDDQPYAARRAQGEQRSGLLAAQAGRSGFVAVLQQRRVIQHGIHARQQTPGVGVVGRDEIQPARPVAARNRGGR